MEANKTKTVARFLFLSVVAAVFLVGDVSVADEVILVDGSAQTNVTISAATWEKVTYQLENVRQVQNVDAKDVVRLVFARETTGLTRGRGAIEAGDYEEAVERLKASATGSGFNGKNASFLLGEAYRGWGFREPAKNAEAVAAYETFLKKFEGEKYFYVPHAHLGAGDAALASGNLAAAEKHFKALDGATYGPRWVAAGKMGLGRVKLFQGDHEAARGIFGLLINDRSVPADLIAEAKLGYAQCQVAAKQYSSAIDTLKGFLKGPETGSPRYTSAIAQGFILYGDAEKELARGDKPKLEGALIRYIRAINIAGAAGEDRAKAMFKAKEVYKLLGNTEKAEALKVRLQRDYTNSPWNK